jgi:hypothetical protein
MTTDKLVGALDGWRLVYGTEGWSNPPPGIDKPKLRRFARCDSDLSVTAWIEAGQLHLKDDECYYPGGCYSLPLSVLAWIGDEGEP